jgi:hypothetical protein
MWTDTLLSMVLYVGPFAALPFTVRRRPTARRIALIALFVAPLIGAAIYLLKNQKFSVGGLLLAYPMAMFPLGFWAALIATLTTPLMFYLKEKYGRVVLMFAAGISGALIGSVFMLVFVRVGTWIQRSTHPVDLSFYLICGLTAGSIVAVLAAWLIGWTDSEAVAVT